MEILLLRQDVLTDCRDFIHVEMLVIAEHGRLLIAQIPSFCNSKALRKSPKFSKG